MNFEFRHSAIPPFVRSVFDFDFDLNFDVPRLTFPFASAREGESEA